MTTLRALAALTLALVPGRASACAVCLGSAFGDRSYSWPYLILILLPFALGTVIAGVIAYGAGVRPATFARRLAPRRNATAPHEETT